MMPWHCRICGRIYKHRNASRRDVLNAWWSHARKFHPSLYYYKKSRAIRKAIKTKLKRYGRKMRR